MYLNCPMVPTPLEGLPFPIVISLIGLTVVHSPLRHRKYLVSEPHSHFHAFASEMPYSDATCDLMIHKLPFLTFYLLRYS